MTHPLITLTTDFGTRDGYTGAMKGCIYSNLPDAQVIDITHDLDPMDIRGGAWAVARATRQFPDESIHVVVVDPGVGSERAPILVRHNRQWLLGPDNGVLSLCWHGNSPEAIYQLHRETQWWRTHRTFDGLALFAPAACCLADGIPAGELGIRQIQCEEIHIPQSREVGTGVIGEIIQFDRFGNAMTNLHKNSLRVLADTPFSILCASRSFALAHHYSEGRKGAPLAVINSDDMLELCCFGQSAQERFQLRHGELVIIQASKPDAAGGNI